MLEYALKQERAKFHKLKYGTELQQGDMKPPMIDESGESQLESDQSYVSVSNSTWREGRQLLRKYLQEIGYTDRIIDVRSTRVRALLGLNNNAEQEENHNGGSVNGNESNKRASETQGKLIFVCQLKNRYIQQFSGWISKQLGKNRNTG